MARPKDEQWIFDSVKDMALACGVKKNQAEMIAMDALIEWKSNRAPTASAIHKYVRPLIKRAIKHDKRS